MGTIPEIASWCHSGRYGCSMRAECHYCLEQCIVSVAMELRDWRQICSTEANFLQRLRNRSRRSRSAAEQMPVQAGAQYMIFATIVARNTSWKWCWNAVTSNATCNHASSIYDESYIWEFRVRVDGGLWELNPLLNFQPLCVYIFSSRPQGVD